MDQVTSALASQMEASLSMVRECLERCPDGHWDGPIAKYPFWQVAYHTLCFADYYLSPNAAAFQPRTGPGGLHPRGTAELDDEYPSRRFERAELVTYAAVCRQKIGETLRTETRETLEGPSGFPRLRFSRMELHIYNLRHVQHHAGQLGAFLRRLGVETGWAAAGWK